MEVKRTFDILALMHEKYNRDDALMVKRNGKWDKYSTSEYKEHVDNFSYGLIELGFKKGDKIATVSNNRPEWNMVDMGLGQVGGVHVPIYPNISDEEYAHIFRSF
jgi:long-chain acyl-CoA synthetase